MVALRVSVTSQSSQTIPAPLAKLDLAIFGGFSLSVNKRRLTVPRQHARLIAYLARQRGAEVSRDRLSTLYWGNFSTEQARRNLRVALSRIKRALGTRTNGAS